MNTSTTVPAAASAGVSLILPVRDGDPALDGRLAAFFAVNTHRPVELIVVDGGATDSARTATARYAERCFCRHVRRAGWGTLAEACALGAAKARLPLLLFWGPQLVFSADVLPWAVAVLTAHAACGAVGVELTTDAGTAAAAPDRLAFLLVRRDDFRAVGGFSRFAADGLEAADFCLRLDRELDKGWSCLPAPGLGLAPVPGGEAQAQKDRRDNRRLFRQRWGRRPPAVCRLVRDGAGSPEPAPRDGLSLLFVLPGHFDSNNGYQVQLLAQGLAEGGARCVIAYPDAADGRSAERPDAAGDEVVLAPYSALRSDIGAFFPGRAGPDLIHAWTPREGVRRFCQAVAGGPDRPLVVHLEDNEELLTETALGRPFADLAGLADADPDGLSIPLDRYHPRLGRRFLDQARGLSLVIDTLGRFNTAGLPQFVLGPQADERLFRPRPPHRALRRELGIPDWWIVLAYTGNVHDGNAAEVDALYRAVVRLNARGYPTVLLRTGVDGGYRDRATGPREAVRQLGWVAREQVGDVLAAADVLVQPGEPGPFNDERVPCKLPEYFAMGRPVILPRTNLGRQAVHGRDAYVLERADAVAIARAVAAICQDRALYDRLAAGATAFYRRHCQTSPADLEAFYRAILAGAAGATGRRDVAKA